jgi:hypothetical protein
MWAMEVWTNPTGANVGSSCNGSGVSDPTSAVAVPTEQDHCRFRSRVFYRIQLVPADSRGERNELGEFSDGFMYPRVLRGRPLRLR